MKVLPTQTGEIAPQQAADKKPDAAKTAAFRSVLASATTETAVPEAVQLRKGEAIQAVDGHAYSEVTSGSREGMFINTSGNLRHGEAFVLVRKNGKEYHVYGTGKDRLVVGFHVPKPADDVKGADQPAADASDIKLRKGEKIEPVEGHAYAEIVSGARSGMYINTSQNSRRGAAFVLVEKADFNYHIYGTGEDRVVIRAAKRDDNDK